MKTNNLYCLICFYPLPKKGVNLCRYCRTDESILYSPEAFSEKIDLMGQKRFSDQLLELKEFVKYNSVFMDSDRLTYFNNFIYNAELSPFRFTLKDIENKNYPIPFGCFQVFRNNMRYLIDQEDFLENVFLDSKKDTTPNISSRSDIQLLYDCLSIAFISVCMRTIKIHCDLPYHEIVDIIWFIEPIDILNICLREPVSISKKMDTNHMISIFIQLETLPKNVLKTEWFKKDIKSIFLSDKIISIDLEYIKEEEKIDIEKLNEIKTELY